MSRQTPNPVVCAVRCGMIYMEAHQLGWKPLKDSYMDTLPSSLTKEHEELVRVWDTPSLHSPSTPGSLLISWTCRPSSTFILLLSCQPLYILPRLPASFHFLPHVVGMGGYGLFLIPAPPSSQRRLPDQGVFLRVTTVSSFLLPAH